MENNDIPKSLRKKIVDAFSNTGVVFWFPTSYASTFDLRTVTNVSENGKERSKSLKKFDAKADFELIAAIQKAYPKIIGFKQSLDAAFYAGSLPANMTLGEMKQMAGVE